MRHFMILAGSVMTLVTFSSTENTSEIDSNLREEIENSRTIGTATMSDCGEISLSLVARDPNTGILGHGFIAYAKSHPDYDMIFDHIGGIHSGERKAVPPFTLDT